MPLTVEDRFEQGLLTAGGAERLLKLSPEGQIAEIERRQAQQEQREHRYRVAAGIIARYLDNHQHGPIDLSELRALLSAGVSATF